MPKPTTAVDPMVRHDPNLAQRICGDFTGKYNLSIFHQPDACKHGKLGELLILR
jgi:transposase